MVRKLFGLGAVALILCVSAVVADDVKGKITKIDPDKKTVTVSKDGKDHDYTVADNCKMPQSRNRSKTGGEAKTMTLKDLEGRVKAAKDRGNDGLTATLVVEKKDGKETVTEIKLSRGPRPGKSDKKGK